jgi:hypothetical protein
MPRSTTERALVGSAGEGRGAASPCRAGVLQRGPRPRPQVMVPMIMQGPGGDGSVTRALRPLGVRTRRTSWRRRGDRIERAP